MTSGSDSPADSNALFRAFPHALERPERTLTLEDLAALPPLAGLSETVLKKIQPYVLPAHYLPGETILREGEFSDAAYYVVDGVVEVVLKRLPALQQTPMPATRSNSRVRSLSERAAELGATAPRNRAVGKAVTTSGTIILSDILRDVTLGERVLLETGEIFGEISALSRYPVSATVQAVSETRCLLVRTPALRILQRSAPKFKEFVDRRYRERALATHLRNVSLFSDRDEKFIDRLKERVDLVSFEPGELIVEEGSPADSFFLVREGFVKVSARSGAADLALTYLRKGDYFGEAAILLDEPWPFSFSAIESVELVKLPRAEFQEILDSSPELKRELWSVTTDRLEKRGQAIRRPVESEYLQMAIDTGLIHGESVLMIDLNTCTGCDDCVRACAETHDGIPRFIREGFKFENWLVPTSCYQCTDPVCMIGCPTGAIGRPIGTTEVSIDPVSCIGCGNCGRRCPWGNIVNVPFHHPVLKKDIALATKCDLCLGRDRPACVQMCPHGSAIRVSFKDVGAVERLLPALG
jgi:CRP-like cAMP-binding protein/Fe-S-cluster-containing hydrogenase component 2